ncbi:MAG: hypothetical protein L3J51_05455 [Cocleimonas sp.]|nr:hypothetical protein [Cocleimonas sp.]
MKNLPKILINCLLIASFSTSLTVSAKESPDEAGLKTAIASYVKIQRSGDIAKVLDSTYPGIFKLAPKEAMVVELKKISSSRTPFIVTKLEQKPELPIKKYKDGVFTKIPYSMEMTMNMVPNTVSDEKKEKMKKILKDPAKLKQFTTLITGMLKKSLGDTAEVNINKDDLKYEIKKTGTYLAINENNAGWTFIDTTSNPMIKLDQVLPKEIYDSIN